MTTMSMIVKELLCYTPEQNRTDKYGTQRDPVANSRFIKILWMCCSYGMHWNTIETNEGSYGKLLKSQFNSITWSIKLNISLQQTVIRFWTHSKN